MRRQLARGLVVAVAVGGVVLVAMVDLWLG